MIENGLTRVDTSCIQNCYQTQPIPILPPLNQNKHVFIMKILSTTNENVISKEK